MQTTKSAKSVQRLCLTAILISACSTQQLSPTSTPPDGSDCLSADRVSDWRPQKNHEPRAPELACSSEESLRLKSNPGELTTEVWHEDFEVARIGRLYLSQQPTPELLKVIGEHGIDTVISLRMPDELEWDEAAYAEASGLRYFNAPLVMQGKQFDASSVADIEELIAERAGEKILLHCSSGNRAAAWLAMHLVMQHGMRESRALDRARRAGLTKVDLEDRIRATLSESR